MQNFGMDIRTLVEQAKSWIAAAKDAAPINKLTEENEELRSEVEALKEQIKQIAKSVDLEEEVAPKKRKARTKKS